MIQRKLYRLLLVLHPASFRQRFGEEMLWLFDQTLDDAGFFQLLTDVALSLAKQHLAVDTAPQCNGRLFQRAAEDGLPAIRILQAGAVASVALVGFLALVQRSVPLPQTTRNFAVRSYRPDVCGELELASRTSERRHKVQ